MSDFTKQYDNFLHEQGGLKNAHKHAYAVWRDKYQGTGLKYGKPAERFTTKILTAGKIYSFLYAPDAKEVKANKFMDHLPILFSLGQRVQNDVLYEVGIDLNLVPIKLRKFIIDRLYTFYNSTIEKNMNAMSAGKNGKNAIVSNFTVLQKILQGTNFEKAYVSMRRDKMGRIQVIDYVDWPLVAVLDTLGIQGKGLNKIHEEYVSSMGLMGKTKDFVKNLIK